MAGGAGRQAGWPVTRSTPSDAQAQRILPQMPTIDEALLKAATMGVFTNLLFNNMFADMAQASEGVQGREPARGGVPGGLLSAAGQRRQHAGMSERGRWLLSTVLRPMVSWHR